MTEYRIFLIEHYKQVNEHDRETNRRRDVLFGSYATIIIGALTFIKDLDYITKTGILAGLVVVGILIAVTVTRFRGWHAEYLNVAKAIHMVFMHQELTLWDAALHLKKERKDYEYFKPQGVEFAMFVLTLALLSLPFIMLYFTFYSGLESMRAMALWGHLVVVAVMVIVTWVAGIAGYRHYLLKREQEFPDKSWCILKQD